MVERRGRVGHAYGGCRLLALKPVGSLFSLPSRIPDGCASEKTYFSRTELELQAVAVRIPKNEEAAKTESLGLKVDGFVILSTSAAFIFDPWRGI